MDRKKVKRRKVNLIAVLFFLFASILYLLQEKYQLFKQHESETSFPVITVHDGDTISTIMNKKQEKVRLIGIDAPEIGQKPWGLKAKEYLDTLLSASDWKVNLEFDVEKRDKYGRILAYLRTGDGKLLNLEMLKNGYALLYTVPPNVKYVEEFRVAQSEARNQGLGIWSENGLKETPRNYREKHPRL